MRGKTLEHETVLHRHGNSALLEGGLLIMVGWIALYRAITDHWVWNTSAKQFQRWVDLLFLASWKPRKVGFGPYMVNVERGQLVTSIRSLMGRWKTNNTTVTSTLNMFVQNGMITYVYDKKRRMTTITIINYNKYQRATMVAEVLENLDMDSDDIIDKILALKTARKKTPDNLKQIHKRVQEQVPIKENNNIINQQLVVEDDAHTKFWDEVMSPSNIANSCKSFGISQEQYRMFVDEILNDWQFCQEDDWSFKHFRNTLRIKVKELKRKENDHGRKSTKTGANHATGSSDAETGNNPLKRARVHRANK